VRQSLTGFVSHDRARDARLATAFRNSLCPQDNGPNDFGIVLNVVNEVQLILRKVLRRRPAQLSLRGQRGAMSAAAHPAGVTRTAPVSVMRENGQSAVMMYGAWFLSSVRRGEEKVFTVM